MHKYRFSSALTVLLGCLVLLGASALAQTPSSIQSGTSLEGCLVRTTSGYVLKQAVQQNVYPLAGDNAALQSHLGQWVRLTGVLEPRHDAPEAPPTMKVTDVQTLREGCGPGSSVSQATPVTGKSGNRADAETVTSTANVGVPTPPVETQSGRAQNPGEAAPAAAKSASHSEYGAPPNWEQVGQERGNDNARSAKVQEAESNGTPGAAKPSTVLGTQDPGAKSAAPPSSVVSGCLERSGTGFVLRESDGEVVHLLGSRETLNAHLNRQVELSGNTIDQAAQAQVAGPAGGREFRVRAARDLAPTCGASPGSAVH